MTANLQTFVLTAHVISSVGLLGAVAAFLALAVAGLVSPDPQMAHAAYPTMRLIAWFVIMPSALASLIIGTFQSLNTKWGLFRYYWVAAKLLLTLLAIFVLLMQMNTIGLRKRSTRD